MCGIVGYVGARPARELLLEGLKKLEYRGYDSAGISVIAGPRIEAVRAVGNLSALEAKLHDRSPIEQSLDGSATAVALAAPPATVGIGHTRWATHGRVSEENAHPHYDTRDHLHVVVNGIVENYIELKHELELDGAHFTSETDAEVIAHLISASYEGDLLRAVRAAYGRLQGLFAFVAMALDEPELLVGARRDCPLVVGRGEHEQFIASAAPAFLAQTRQVQYLENGDIVLLRPDSVVFLGSEGQPVERALETVAWSEETAEKGGYETFMLKEISEQPDVLAETVADRTARGSGVDLADPGTFDESLLEGIRRILIVACGTSYHAGMIGRSAIEEWARIPVEVDIASEFRYRNSVLLPGDLVIGISQSGETADTLAAMRRARDAGATVLALTNVMGSQATRDAHGTLFTRAGLEIGVAASKTFICQVALMYLLALRLAELRGTLTEDELTELVGQVKSLPRLLEGILVDQDLRESILRLAERYARADFFLYIGRNIGLPVALEGALKLKEISYIATDAYPAGEMKHGPIALLDESTPVVCVATHSPVSDKLASNMQEVKARGAHVIAIATAGDRDIAAHADHVIPVPDSHWMLQPILAVLPLQLLAYHIARARGLNVDQPRHLAKTVTVE